MQGAALGAEPSEIGRMIWVAAHAYDLGSIALRNDAASDATVAAGSLSFD